VDLQLVRIFGWCGFAAGADLPLVWICPAGADL
jgi:hypothetical protein